MKGEKTQKQDEDLNKRPIMHKDKEGGASEGGAGKVDSILHGCSRSHLDSSEFLQHLVN